MNRTPIILFAGVLVLTVVAILIWPSAKTPAVSLSESAVTPAPFPPAPEPMNNSKAVAKPALVSADDAYDPYAEQAIQAQMLQIADLYAETSKYPNTSQPINNLDAVREPEPFEETEVDTPFPVDGLDTPIRLLAAVDQYQYFAGDSIKLRLQVVGAPSDTFVQANAVISGANGDTPLAAPLTATDETLTNFIGNFDTRVAPPGLFSPEMLVKVRVSVGEEQLFTTVAFRYAEAAATLVAVPSVRQQNEWLQIALQYSVSIPGYYFVTAVLEDARSGQPLIALQDEGRMQQGNGLLTLKAHFQALKAMGSEGPYILRSINTYRAADSGETFNAPASTVQRRFEIPGFAFSDYDDVPYQNDEAAERLEFLRDLGPGDSPE